MNLQCLLRSFSALLLAAAATWLVPASAAAQVTGPNEKPPAWQDGKPVALPSFQVSVSKPVLVARSKGYLWFPTLVRLVNGDCLAVMSNYADTHVEVSTALSAWSHDGGFSWTKPIETQYGDVALRRAGDDELLLPYYLHKQPDGTLGDPYQICPKRKQELRVVKEGVAVTGLPRKDKSINPKTGLAGFVFNGQSVKLKNGSYLAMLYGTFEDDKRYSLLAAESADGVRWAYKSTIADDKCPLDGAEGPCESAVCRLADGRLMCVFRLAANVPYGQTYSEDEGKSWSPATAMKGPFSVQPSLAVMKDGTVALSGGRPGLFLWLNADKTGKEWQKIDLLANHNAQVPDEPIKAANNTSAYTEVVTLDDEHLLVIYDRIPNSWSAIPEGSPETNSVWIVRVKVTPMKSGAP